MFDGWVILKAQEHRVSLFFSFCLALMPLLNIYISGIPGVGLGELVIGFIVIILFIRNRGIKIGSTETLYLFFFCYALLITLLNWFIHPNYSLRDIVVRLVIFLFYTMILIVPNNSDFIATHFYKVYISLAIVASVFALVQVIAFSVFHIIILGIIPGIPLNYPLNSYALLLDNYASLYSYFFRPTSLFLEPAHLAQFLGIALILTLYANRKTNYYFAILITLASLLSTSTSAIIYTAIIWIIYFAFISIKTNNIKSFTNTLLVFVLFISVLFLVNKISPTFNYGFSRIQNLLSNDVLLGSGYERVFKGFDVWRQLSWSEKLFGIGFGTYDSYYSLGLVQVYNGQVEYMSSISYIFVSAGVVGFSLFSLVIVKIIQSKDIMKISLAAFLVILFVSSSIFNTPIYIITMILTMKTSSNQPITTAPVR